MDYSDENFYILYKYEEESIFKIKIVINENEAKEWSSHPGNFYTKTKKEKKFLCC